LLAGGELGAFSKMFVEHVGSSKKAPVGVLGRPAGLKKALAWAGGLGLFENPVSVFLSSF
jgi:hypothetical protein